MDSLTDTMSSLDISESSKKPGESRRTYTKARKKLAMFAFVQDRRIPSLQQKISVVCAMTSGSTQSSSPVHTSSATSVSRGWLLETTDVLSVDSKSPQDI